MSTTTAKTSAKPAKNKGGRGNLAPVDPEAVRILAATQAPVRRIAAVMNCDEKTLRNRFRDVIELGREAGLSKLQQRQWQAAMDGNITMMIWLGKQYLGQSDKSEVKQSSHGVSQEHLTRVMKDPKVMAKAKELANLISGDLEKDKADSPQPILEQGDDNEQSAN